MQPHYRNVQTLVLSPIPSRRLCFVKAPEKTVAAQRAGIGPPRPTRCGCRPDFFSWRPTLCCRVELVLPVLLQGLWRRRVLPRGGTGGTDDAAGSTGSPSQFHLKPAASPAVPPVTPVPPAEGTVTMPTSQIRTEAATQASEAGKTEPRLRFHFPGRSPTPC